MTVLRAISCRSFVLLAIVLFLLHASPVHGQFDLVLVPNIQTRADGYLGNGASYVDFNQDGYDDLTLASTTGGIKTFLGSADGTYSAVDYGFDVHDDVRHVLWVDIDNDGDLDLFATQFAHPIHVFRNDDFNFVNVSSECGILQTNAWQTMGASFGDYDHDGDLDVYINNMNISGATTNYLYNNDGNGHFTDVTSIANCSNGVQNTFQSLWYDYNHDGWLDLFVINDRLTYPNALYKNKGDGTFVDVAPEVNFDQMIYAMSLTCGDQDNDGDFDMYVTNGIEGNLFLDYKATSDMYVDLALQNGTQVNSVSWGALWCDYDNNGLQDLFVSTYPWGSTSSSNHLFVNEGDSEFTPHNEFIEEDASNVYAPVMGDANNDGYPDIYLHTIEPASYLLLNEGGTNNWLKTKVQGTVSNSFGIGSRITVWAAGTSQARFTYCGENYLGQNSLWQFFGMASSAIVDSVYVEWPSGFVDRYYDLPVNNAYTFIEGETYSPDHFTSGQTCSGSELSLIIDEPEATVTWNTGDVGSILTVTNTGTYSAEITTPEGIVSDVEFTVEFTPAPEMSAMSSDVTCAGMENGSIVLSNSSGVDVSSVEWNGGQYTGLELSNLAAGTFEYNVTDVNGCTCEGLVAIEAPSVIEAEALISPPSCAGEAGSVVLELSGGTGDLVPDWGSANPENLFAGSYTFDVHDALGCSENFSIEIVEPEPLDVELNWNEASGGDNGSASVEITGGTLPYNIQWSTGAQGETIEGIGQGFYTVMVTDANDCFWTDYFSLLDVGITPMNSEDFCSITTQGSGYEIRSFSPNTLTFETYTYTGQLIERMLIQPGQVIYRPINNRMGIRLLRVTDGVTQRVVKLLH